MTRSTEEMIRELSTELPPVKPLGRLRDTVIAGLGIALPIFALWIYNSGLRRQFQRGESPDAIYLLVVCVSLLIATGGVVAGLAAAVPGREVAYRVGRNIFTLGFALGLLALGYQVASGATSFMDALGSSLSCIGGATVLGVPAALFAARFVNRGEAARPPLALAQVSIGGVGFSAAVVHLTCSHPDPAHLVLGHGLAPLMGGLVVLLGLSLAFGLVSRLGRRAES
jgi:hypothetical protein